MARPGPDWGTKLQWPFRLTLKPLSQRAEVWGLSNAVAPEVMCHEQWDFNGKFASGIGSGLATRIVGTTPTVAQVANSANGEVLLTLTDTDEAQVAGLDWTDQKQIPGNRGFFFQAIIKTPAAAYTTAENVFVGLATNYHVNLSANISKLAGFRLNASNVVQLEGKDGTNSYTVGGGTQTTTTKTLAVSTTYVLTIDAHRLDKVQFFINEPSGLPDRVGSLNLSAFAATDLLQPAIWLQKASGTTTPTLTVDLVRAVWYRL
jgi:hypothetical protein